MMSRCLLVPMLVLALLAATPVLAEEPAPDAPSGGSPSPVVVAPEPVPAQPSVPPAPSGVVVPGFASRIVLSGDASLVYEHLPKARLPSGAGLPETTTFGINTSHVMLDAAFTPRLAFSMELGIGFFGRPVYPTVVAAIYRPFDTALEIWVGQVKPYSLNESLARFWQLIKPGASGATTRCDDWDRGVLANGRLWDRRIFYAAQIVNGNGIFEDSNGKNDNTAFRTGLLVELEPLGPLSPFNNDRDHTPLKFGVGAGATFSRDRDAVVTFQDKRWLAANAYVKGEGLFAKAFVADLHADRTAGATKSQRYGSLQAGYSVPIWFDHVLEPVARYSILDPDLATSGDRQQAMTVGATYYLYGQSAKLQVNYTFKREQPGARVDNDVLDVAAWVLF